MKKVILSLVFVLATGSMMNANSKLINNLTFGNCTQDAWDYGTEAGEGNPVLEYEYTNQYFELHCNSDGTYKLTKI